MRIAWHKNMGGAIGRGWRRVQPQDRRQLAPLAGPSISTVTGSPEAHRSTEDAATTLAC